MSTPYQPRDELSLWWVGDPTRPVLVGELNLVRSLRGVSLRYADDWCTRGFALSEDLPLLPGQEFLPRERDTAAGSVDDARPDRWGERVIRFLDKPGRLEKNHALLVDDTTGYELAPAFDVLPSGQALGYQQLRVGVNAGDSTLENALSMCSQFGLKPAAAKQEIRAVAGVVARWREHFARTGVSGSDIEHLAEQVDRPFLREQRDEYAS